MYHQWFPVDEAFRTVSLTFCSSNLLGIEAVVIAVESGVESPSAGVALCYAVNGFQESADGAEHIMLLARVGI
jgi:hypothetical protein